MSSDNAPAPMAEGSDERAPSAPAANSSRDTRRNLQGIPTLYGDQVVDVIYGASTSKIVLGIEDGIGNEVRRIAVVVLPTPALALLASNVIATTSSDRFLAETTNRFEGLLDLYRGGPAALAPEDQHD